jgi:hypothetical protein
MLLLYKISYKVATRYMPYQLMYGLHPLMHIEYILAIASGNERDNISLRVIINKIRGMENLHEA